MKELEKSWEEEKVVREEAGGKPRSSRIGLKGIFRSAEQ